MPQPHFPEQIHEILALPMPEGSNLAKARATELRPLAAHLLNSWKSLITRYGEITGQSAEYKCPSCGKGHILSGRDLWYRIFLITGAYYDFAVRRLIVTDHTGRTKATGAPPGINVPANQAFIEQFPSNDKPSDLHHAHVVIVTYMTSLIAAYFIPVLRTSPVPAGLTSVFESTAHADLSRLTSSRSGHPHPDLGKLAQRLSAGLIELLANAYSQEQPWNREHRPGPFSTIRLPELALLATRQRSMSERYGTPHIEKVFEQQLALVFQSFGFLVVTTRRGERTVDLVCISGDPREAMTILVEAKTSSGQYRLPVSDQRALNEYAVDVRKNLTTLPKLTVILLVTPSPAHTVEQRLKQLEVEIDVPTRLITAQALADLREAIAGPLPLAVFRDAVLGSDTRVLDKVGATVVASHKAVEAAHAALVRTMLKGTAAPNQITSGWDEHDSSHAKQPPRPQAPAAKAPL